MVSRSFVPPIAGGCFNKSLCFQSFAAFTDHFIRYFEGFIDLAVAKFEGAFPTLVPASFHKVDVKHSGRVAQIFIVLKCLKEVIEEAIGVRVGVIFIHGVAVGLLVNYWGLRARKFKPRHTPLSEIFVSVKFSTLINRCQQPNSEERKKCRLNLTRGLNRRGCVCFSRISQESQYLLMR